MDELKYDIEKYLKGELSPSEMHALEKRALDDPFLADALEGSSNIDANLFDSDIKQLREELQTNRKSTVNLWTWAGRIAAGIAFIALSTFLIINFTTDKNNKTKLSVNQPAPKQAEKKKEEVPPVIAEKKQEEKSSSGQVTHDDEAKPQQPEGARSAAIEQKKEFEEQPLEIQSGANAEDIVIQESSTSAAPPSIAKAEVERKRADGHLINGHVIDSEDGKGLPGVNVMIKGTNIGTVTNEEGQYQIAMDSLSTGLSFSFIGFESKEVVPGSTNLDVTLSPDIAQLSEVVVVGYSPDKEPEEFPLIEMASPAGGKKAFKHYLEQNLKYPDLALNNKIEGKVTVQFTIESSGKVGDFQVLKGIGYGCDDEVIRLIKEGPSWVPTKRNQETVRDKVKVRLRFSLPKKK